MPTIIQINNVPSDLHRRLTEKAAGEGVSLADYVLRVASKALGTAAPRASKTTAPAAAASAKRTVKR